LLCRLHFFGNVKVAASFVLHFFLLLYNFFYDFFCMYVQFVLFFINLGNIFLTLWALEVITGAHCFVESELSRFNLLLASVAESCFCCRFHHSDHNLIKF